MSEKYWVAIRWQSGDLDRWMTSDRPISEKAINQMIDKARFHIDLAKYGIDFLAFRNFITAVLYFRTKEEMERAEKKGFDNCLEDMFEVLTDEDN